MATNPQNTTQEVGYQLKGDRPDFYEQYWVPALMGACAEDLVDAACLQAGENVLDVACGTGVVVRAVALRANSQNSITGTDINDVMVSTAQRDANSKGLQNIKWHIADATDMPFNNAIFDVVLCQQGLQFMPNCLAAMCEIKRVLAPGGRFVASVWKSGSPFGIALRKALDTQFGEGTTSNWDASISLGDRFKLRAIAKEAGFTDYHISYDVKIGRHHAPEEFVSGVIKTTSLAEEFANLAVIDQEKLTRSVVSALEYYMDDNGLAYPAECHTLIARK